MFATSCCVIQLPSNFCGVDISISQTSVVYYDEIYGICDCCDDGDSCVFRPINQGNRFSSAGLHWVAERALAFVSLPIPFLPNLHYISYILFSYRLTMFRQTNPFLYHIHRTFSERSFPKLYQFVFFTLIFPPLLAFLLLDGSYASSSSSEPIVFDISQNSLEPSLNGG